jgi:hypothetical protein
MFGSRVRTTFSYLIFSSPTKQSITKAITPIPNQYIHIRQHKAIYIRNVCTVYVHIHRETERKRERDLDIAGLEIYEEEIPSNNTNRNSKSKSTKTQYGTEETHLKPPSKKPNKNFLTNQTTPGHNFLAFSRLLRRIPENKKTPFPIPSSSPQITDPPPE